MGPVATSPAVSFRLRDVLGDAFASVRADLGAHLGWNALVLGLLAMSCCGLSCGVLAAILGLAAGGEIPQPGDPTQLQGPASVFLAALYALLFVLWAGLYAVHQSVTYALAYARARGTPLTMRAAIQAGLRRTPTVLAHFGIRFVVEGVPIVILDAGIFGVMWATTGQIVDFRQLGAPAWSAIAAMALLGTTGTYAYRAFFGLSTTAVAVGAHGPVRAFGASRELLRDHRWKFVGLRVFVLLVWALAYGVLMGPVVALSSGGASPAASLVTLPLMLLFYLVMLGIMAFDAILETCFYDRLARPLDTATLARTFE